MTTVGTKGLSRIHQCLKSVAHYFSFISECATGFTRNGLAYGSLVRVQWYDSEGSYNEPANRSLSAVTCVT